MNSSVRQYSFTIEPEGEGCRVVQRIEVRTGSIGARLDRREFNAVREHMKEEGENLRRILEARHGPSIRN